MPRKFKMSNIHVCIFYLSKTYILFSFVGPHQRLKGEEFDMIEVE